MSRGGGPRPGAAPRPGGGLSGGASSSGRQPESNSWGADRQQQQQHQEASTTRPRQQQRRSRAPARVPTGKGNRELVRRALSPPAARGVLRRWSFRPSPSRLRNGSSSSSSLSPVPGVVISACA
ncbi:hypothetical protein PR202_gb21282 [Eleusine coracana subsp. coracana]|uniref:Uncharacterized protein n=1 Tax=Eleusine coracana subsp. coracana TaxID=191504 RepID=A0AAV5FAR7_ELECO|nr:hypothetical protein PR202_gb21282 [Eleusine coracana subsp. coracana]